MLAAGNEVVRRNCVGLGEQAFLRPSPTQLAADVHRVDVAEQRAIVEGQGMFEIGGRELLVASQLLISGVAKIAQKPAVLSLRGAVLVVDATSEIGDVGFGELRNPFVVARDQAGRFDIVERSKGCLLYTSDAAD